MSKVQFTQQLFEQLGGSSWVARPDYFQTDVAAEVSSESVEAGNQNIAESDVVVEPVASPIEVRVNSEDEYISELVTEQAVVEGQSQLSEPVVENAVVLIGSGLDAAWQNEESLEWQLWLNIMFAFGWDEAQIVFYDTSYLATEEMVFSTMEEIIDLSVDWVLTMDAEHALSEQLAEGVQVVDVPEFELMLSDPYAKKAFYQAVVQLNS